MKRRTTSDEERRQFEQDFRQARPIKPVRTGGPAKRTSPPMQDGSGVNGATQARLKRGALEPDAKIDLHGRTEAAAHRALLAFLGRAQASGLRLVLVVTGKGNPAKDEAASWAMRSGGVLKQMVPRWLREPEFAAAVAHVQTAHARHGGGGALYVYLRKRR